jgi:hypothetical protein
VPYKGAVLALNDLIAGQLQFIMAQQWVALRIRRVCGSETGG